MRFLFWTIGILVCVAAAGWLLHRLAIMLEDAGYMYYREQPKGGSGARGVLSEIDRVVRPTIEHSVEQQDAVKIERDDVGGD